MKIGIIGKGNVGSAIGSGLSRAGHEVKHGHRDPKESVEGAAKWGDVVFLAVPFDSVSAAAAEMASFVDNKVVVDVTNAIGANFSLAVGCSTSGAEELQKNLPKARVVKAFNTVFAANQSTGRLGEEQLTLFVAGDDFEAKKMVMALGEDIGFNSVDAGPLRNARFLEPMGMLMINLGLALGMGTKIGFKLVRV